MEKSKSGDGQKSYVELERAIVNHAHLHIPSIKVWHRVNHSLGMYVVHIHKVALCLSSF